MGANTQSEPKELTREEICFDKEKHPIMEWFLMSEEEILSKFAALPKAQRVGEGEEQFVYVPGTRPKKDRALLVAHSDTVFGNKQLDVGYYSGHYFSLKKGVGVGADDRAGCFALWELRDLGHSLLIPATEESGCKGSRYLMRHKEWADVINKHNFAIEFDRMNEFDMAFYNVGSFAFKDWCEEQFTGYKRTHGMFTDICHLCDPMCGMNISVGYYGQHGDDEYLVEAELERTIQLSRKVLSQKGLPSFRQDPPTPVKTYSTGGNCGNAYTGYPRSENHRENITIGVPRNPTNHKTSGTTENIIVCPSCDAVMDVNEWKNNHDHCIYCKQGV